MSAILTPRPTDTDPGTGIQRTPVEAVQPPVVVAYPDAPMFGPTAHSQGKPISPQSATDMLHGAATADAQRRHEVLADLAALTQKITGYGNEAAASPAYWEWNLLRRQIAALQESAHQILLPEREDDDIEAAVREDI